MIEFRNVRQLKPKEIFKKLDSSKTTKINESIKIQNRLIETVRAHPDFALRFCQQNVKNLKSDLPFSNEQKIITINQMRVFADELLRNYKDLMPQKIYLEIQFTICLTEIRLGLKIDARDTLRKLIKLFKQTPLHIDHQLQIFLLAVKLGFHEETQEILLKLINDYDSRIIIDLTTIYIYDLDKESKEKELEFLERLYKFLDNLPEDKHLSVANSKILVAAHYTILGKMDIAKEIINKQKGFARRLIENGKYTQAISIYLQLIWDFCINLLEIKDNKINLSTKFELMNLFKEYIKFGFILDEEAKENDSNYNSNTIGRLYEVEEWFKKYKKENRDLLESN